MSTSILRVDSASSLVAAGGTRWRVAGAPTASRDRGGFAEWQAGIEYVQSWVAAEVGVTLTKVGSVNGPQPFARVTGDSSGGLLVDALTASGLVLAERPRYAFIEGLRLPIPVYPDPADAVPVSSGPVWPAEPLVCTCRGGTGLWAVTQGPWTMQPTGVQTWAAAVPWGTMSLAGSGSEWSLYVAVSGGGGAAFWYLPNPADGDPRGLYQGSSWGGSFGGGAMLAAVLDQPWG